jgi:CHASE1-domain containing sensor protein
MTSRATPRTQARWHTVAVILLLAVGVTLSCLLFVWVQRFEQEKLQVEFRQRATAGATAIQRSVQEHLGVLYNLGAFIASARPFNRETFRELTTGLLKRYPEVQGLGWVPRVTEAEREVFLAGAHKEGMADFEITEWTPRWQVVRAARRDVYYPIFYIAPMESQQAALGFNLGSVPAYMEAMQKALSTEEVTASAWYALTQETGEQFGFLLFFPIYKSGMLHRTFEERRASLQGFTMAIFRLSTLVEKPLQGLELGPIGLELSDVTDAASRYLLSLQLSASHVAAWTFLLRQSAKAEAIRAGTHWETNFNVAGRQWSVLFHPLSEAWHVYAWQAWGVLVGGLLLTLLCVGFLRLKWRSDRAS